MYKILHSITGYLLIFLLYLNFIRATSCDQSSAAVSQNQRILKCHVNPGCDFYPECKLPNGSSINLIHIEAIGPNDTIHYIWSTYNTPSIFIAQTSHNAALMIDWKKLVKFQPNGVLFSEAPIMFSALVLTQLWQYDDSADKVSLPSNSNTTVSLNVTNFYWDSANVNGNSTVTATMSAVNGDPVFSENGTFKIEFSASGLSEASKTYPHLLFNGNSTQMKLTLNNLQTVNEKYRFAAEFLAVSFSSLNDSWYHDISNSIDDEYSPGVFKIHHLHPPYDPTDQEQSFLIWKPVAYLGEKPTVANSSDASASKLSYSNDIPPSIVSLLCENITVTKVSWNMTFGTSGDGWYKHTKFTSWSVMIGLGDPAFESLSVLAKIVIGIGLGAPCAIILGGGGFLLYKKFRKNEDDELLLAR